MPGFFLVVVGLFIDEVFVFLFNARDTLNGPLLSFVTSDPVHSHGSFFLLAW